MNVNATITLPKHDKRFEFFNTHRLDDWTFSKYVTYIIEQLQRPPRTRNLFPAFLKCLLEISEMNVPSEVKTYALQAYHNTQADDAESSTNVFEHSMVVSNNLGNMNFSYNQPQPHSQQQQQSEQQQSQQQPRLASGKRSRDGVEDTLPVKRRGSSNPAGFSLVDDSYDNDNDKDNADNDFNNDDGADNDGADNNADNDDDYICSQSTDDSVKLQHQRYLVFRKEVIEKAEAKKHLSKTEQLALNFILETDNNKPKPPYLTEHEWNSLNNLLRSEYDNVAIPSNIMSLISEFSLEERKVKRNKLASSIPDEKVKTLLNVINANYGNTFNVSKLEEDNYLQFTLEPLLNSLFQNKDDVFIDGSSSSLASSSVSRKRFDSSLLAKKADYCVYIICNDSKKNIDINETKSVKSIAKKESDDDVKLANIMKDALDDLYNSNLGDTVLGVLVQGTKVDLYIMDLKYNSIYRMYKYLTCYVPVDNNDFGRIPRLITGLLTLESHFTTIKNHIDSIAVQQYTRNRLSPPRTLRFNEPSFLSPNRYPKS